MKKKKDNIKRFDSEINRKLDSTDNEYIIPHKPEYLDNFKFKGIKHI